MQDRGAQSHRLHSTRQPRPTAGWLPGRQSLLRHRVQLSHRPAIPAHTATTGPVPAASVHPSFASSNRRLVAASAGKDSSLTPWSSGGPPSRRPDGSEPQKPAPRAHTHPGDGPSLDLSAGTAALIALNVALFAGAAFAKLPVVAGMALYNANGSWLQYVSSAFVHANLAHLSRNMFLLWLWGSALRREVTGGGLWFAYIASAVGANLAAAYALGAKAKASTALLGVAASGGVAGVALAALALTARPSLRWLLAAALAAVATLPPLLAAPVPYMPGAAAGAAAAGQSALARLLPPWLLSGAGEYLTAGGGGAAGVAAAGGGGGVSAFFSALKSPAMSWLWGAAAGALVVVVLARLPVPPE